MERSRSGYLRVRPNLTPIGLLTHRKPLLDTEHEGGSTSYQAELDRPGQPLLVAFGGLRGAIGIPGFEFRKVLSDFDCNLLFVRDVEQAWYQGDLPGLGSGVDGLVEGVRGLVATADVSRVVCLGNSMGGYAALLVGSAIEADEVIAFSPVTFINWSARFLAMDRRWGAAIRYSRSRPTSHPPSFDLGSYLREPGWGRARVYADLSYRLDRIQANRLEGLPRLRVESRPGRHGLVRELRDSGELAGLLASAMTGTDAD